VDVAMYVPNVITSPIAYLASNNFLDPFRAPDAAATYMRYRYMDVDSLYGKGSASAEAYGSFYGKWRISSSGPDRIFGPTGYLTYQGVSYNILCPYDPTNGTVSNGDIMRSQRNLMKIQVLVNQSVKKAFQLGMPFFFWGRGRIVLLVTSRIRLTKESVCDK
jgi:hypothetical protein